MATLTRTRTGRKRGAMVLPLFAAILLCAGAVAAAQQAAAPAAPAPPAAPAAAAPPGAPVAIPPAAEAPPTVKLGLCQCITDKKGLDFSCPGSAQACQAACGQKYSYAPLAQCPPAGQ